MRRDREEETEVGRGRGRLQFYLCNILVIYWVPIFVLIKVEKLTEVAVLINMTK